MIKANTPHDTVLSNNFPLLWMSMRWSQLNSKPFPISCVELPCEASKVLAVPVQSKVHVWVIVTNLLAVPASGEMFVFTVSVAVAPKLEDSQMRGP